MKSLISQLGFTLIELLVVISVIGVLAVAVLSSINPIEQINKGRDSGAESDASQLINATDGYFASQEVYPWNDKNYACGIADKGTNNCALSVGVGSESDIASQFPYANNPKACTAQAAAPGQFMCKLDATGGLWMDGLSDTAEVKDSFVSRVRSQTTYAIYVYKPAGSNETMVACFKPTSLSFQSKALAACQDPSIGGNLWGTALTQPIAQAMCPNFAANPPGANYTVDANKNELICLPYVKN
jgi:prepilin-type N-terminal cleavage/methylation domain-containing protein